MIDPDHGIRHNVGSLWQGIGRVSPRMSISSLRINLSVRTGRRVQESVGKSITGFCYLGRVYNPEKIFDFELLLCNPYVQQHSSVL